MRWTVVLVWFVMLGGCGVAASFAAPEVISGDQNEVAVKSGINSNPGPTAQAHCARYNRTAVLNRGPIEVGLRGRTNVYYFNCT